MSVTSEHLVRETADLVVRARDGDADSFSGLIRRYERTALSVAYSILGNADAAGDVVQDAFLKAWQRLKDLKEPAHFATWLCGIARNLAIDLHRRGRFMKGSVDAAGPDALSLADPRESADPLEELGRRERRERVGAALESLDDVTRPAVVLRYYDGLSSKEIGKILNMSPAAVDMRLSRARQQLKSLLSFAEVSHG